MCFLRENIVLRKIINDKSSYVNIFTKIYRIITFMSIISIRIKEIRIDNNLTQEEFGKILGTSQDNVSLWEKGKSVPGAFQIIAIAKNFKVSADYLLGLQDY